MVSYRNAQCGQPLYLISGLRVKKVVFLRDNGDRCLVSTDSGGAIRVSRKRLFTSSDEAEEHLPRVTIERTVVASDEETVDCSFAPSRQNNHVSQTWRYADYSVPGDGWAKR